MHNDPEKKKNTAFFISDLKHSHLTVNKNKSPGGFEKRLLRKGFRSTFCHRVNGSTCGDLVPPSLFSRQRAWDGLLWPLGYLTDGAVPSPAPNLHSVHRNDSLKSAQAKPAERTPSTTRANAACAGGGVCFPLSFLLFCVLVLLLNSLSLFLLMWNFNASPFVWLNVIVIVEQREMHFELEAVFHFCFYI